MVWRPNNLEAGGDQQCCWGSRYKCCGRFSICGAFCHTQEPLGEAGRLSELIRTRIEAEIYCFHIQHFSEKQKNYERKNFCPRVSLQSVNLNLDMQPDFGWQLRLINNVTIPALGAIPLAPKANQPAKMIRGPSSSFSSHYLFINIFCSAQTNMNPPPTPHLYVNVYLHAYIH